jgi:K+-transporting ATPase ATPase A chain
VIVITGGLIYFPAVSLGPIVEQIAMHAGTIYSGS